MRRPVAWNTALPNSGRNSGNADLANPTRPERIENAIVFGDAIDVDGVKVRERHVTLREICVGEASVARVEHAPSTPGYRLASRAITDTRLRIQAARQPAHASQGSQSSTEVQLDYLHAIFRRSSLREPASISSQSCGVSSS